MRHGCSWSQLLNAGQDEPRTGGVIANLFDGGTTYRDVVALQLSATLESSTCRLKSSRNYPDLYPKSQALNFRKAP